MNSQIIIRWPRSHTTKNFDNCDSMNKYEPQKKYRLGTVNILNYGGGAFSGLTGSHLVLSIQEIDVRLSNSAS